MALPRVNKVNYGYVPPYSKPENTTTVDFDRLLRMIRKTVDIGNEIELGIETDPIVCAEIAARHERCLRNWRWLESNAERAYSNRGKYICIAGQELFVADSPETVLNDAKAAHPDDNGRFVLYVPEDTVPRIYAC